MEKSILDALVGNPKLVPWLIAFAIAMFLTKIFNKRAEDAISKVIDSAETRRIEAFVLLLQIGVGIGSAVWCYLFSNFPPPFIDPELTSPFGPEFVRAIGYFYCAVAAIFAAGFLIFRGARNELGVKAGTVENFVLGSGSRMYFVGTIAATIVVIYTATLDPHFISDREIPSAGYELTIWWCTWIPMLSLSFGVLIYGTYVLIQLLWQAAARIP